MAYLSAKEIATKWGISQRRVAALCSENRVAGAFFVGNVWVIPKNTPKPLDARKRNAVRNNIKDAKPFLKWAGGKGQLLKEIDKYYPFKKDKSITKYAEPFVGGGAVLFDILNKYSLDKVYISDINKDLTDAFIAVRDNVDEIINRLELMEKGYLKMSGAQRRKVYLEARSRFNELKHVKKDDSNLEKSTLMIFLNKTCFNGLYRVNKKGDFNVPIGGYKNPKICDENNLRAASRRLKNVKIVCADYKKSASFIDDKTFVYFDPPYRPLTPTANFTSYTKELFDDNKQLELAHFVQELDNKGAKIVVSNSDPKNSDKNDNFFDEIYANQSIKRVLASRAISRNGNARGKVSELLISNFNN